ncbi:hypothetical protein QYM36_007755 [Artemia franciscana]|uniref:Uncharacterized protein n=1 Tax=Artemia franciscana TaxID=6661 RepID=A0AA88IE61_ARTSF|nr:hypothetical protein QYM36_007755 [Artemia franciscana]
MRSVKRKSTRLVIAVEKNHYQTGVINESGTRLNGVFEETIPIRDSYNSYFFRNSGAYDGSGDHGVSFMIGHLTQKKTLPVWDPANPRIARLRLKERLPNMSGNRCC